MKSNVAYHILAFLVIATWGFTFISTRLLIDHGLSPQEIFFLRFLLAYVGILFFAPRRLFCDNLKDELWMLSAGIAGGSLYFLAENTAIGITLVTNVSFIVCNAPLFNILFSLLIFRNKRATPSLILGTLLSVTGVAMVVWNGNFVLKISPLGDLLSLLAAWLWVFYSQSIARVSSRYDSLFTTRKVFFYGLLTILPAFIWKPWGASLSVFRDPVVWTNLAFLGIIASLLCYYAWNVVLKRLGTIRASSYIYLNPLFTLVGSYLFLDEQMTGMALVGAALILTGVWTGRKGLEERVRRE